VNIYPVEQKIRHILLSVDPETGEIPEDMEAELDLLYDTREAMIEDLLRERANTVAEIAGLEAVVAGLEARADAEKEAVKRIDRQIERSLNGDPFKCEAGAVTWRKSEGLVIENEAAVGEEWRKVKTVESIDKAGLKKAIKAGLSVSYAYIETRQNMSVK
jgi:hypothetical protein